VALEGPLKEFHIQDVFQLLDLGRKSGVLRVTSELRQTAGTVCFDRGGVVAAALGSDPQPLGARLVRVGKITAADLDRAAQALFGRPLGIAEAAVHQALDPAANIRARTVLGGPAPDNMRAMIAARRLALAADRGAVQDAADRVAAARARCFALARDRAAAA
jgi:3-hydroxyacyl-CoA dehydrogenase